MIVKAAMQLSILLVKFASVASVLLLVMDPWSVGISYLGAWLSFGLCFSSWPCLS
jgi:hypothetical protein